MTDDTEILTKNDAVSRGDAPGVVGGHPDRGGGVAADLAARRC